MVASVSISSSESKRIFKAWQEIALKTIEQMYYLRFFVCYGGNYWKTAFADTHLIYKLIKVS